MAKELSEVSVKIREYLEKHPDVKPKDVAEALKVDVSKVNAQKNALKKLGSPVEPRPATATPTIVASVSSGEVAPIALMKDVRGLVKVYGASQVKTIVDMMTE